jgi:hypothetical protein
LIGIGGITVLLLLGVLYMLCVKKSEEDHARRRLMIGADGGGDGDDGDGEAGGKQEFPEVESFLIIDSPKVESQLEKQGLDQQSEEEPDNQRLKMALETLQAEKSEKQRLKNALETLQADFDKQTAELEEQGK